MAGKMLLVMVAVLVLAETTAPVAGQFWHGHLGPPKGKRDDISPVDENGGVDGESLVLYLHYTNDHLYRCMAMIFSFLYSVSVSPHFHLLTFV
jgi:hypothetical protein